MAKSPETRLEKQLLEQLVVGNDDLEKLESLLDEFNAFEAIGAVRSELRHSDFLSFLLNPIANHRLGDELLKAFLKKALANSQFESVSVIDIDVYDFSDAEVRREWRNIDLLVVSNSNKLVIAIENKIDSSEHSNQLTRYSEILSTEFPNYRKVSLFLTPAGDVPSDQTWIPVSYSELVQTIERVVNSHASTMGQDVKMLCDHYTTMVRRHIVSESETAVLCRKLYKRHKQAFDLIFEHKPDLQAVLYEALCSLVLDEAPAIELDHCTKTHVRFVPNDWDKCVDQLGGSGWTKTKRVLLYEFQNYDNGLVLKLIIGPGADDFRNLIWETVQKNKSLFSGATSKLYTKWTQILAVRFLTKKDLDNLSMDDLVEKIENRWSRFLGSEYLKVKKIIDLAIFD